MAGDNDLIWIQEAVIAYGRSRAWIEKQMKDGVLHKVPQLGTDRVYLRRSELDTVIGPPEKRITPTD